MSSLLVAQGLWKSYRTESEELGVLRGLDLAVEAGEVVAIVGVSGVGKSTLLHLLGALDRPDAGEVRIAGEPIAKLSPERLAAVRNRSIGFVFQFHYLLPEFTALENAAMPLLIQRVDPSAARARAAELLGELGLSERLTHPPHRLSGGEQQRVAIARALVTAPSVLLADEPTGNLDPRTGRIVFDLMRGLAKRRGMASIVATHNESLAEACDRIIHLCEGQLRDVSLPLEGSRTAEDPEGPGAS